MPVDSSPERPRAHGYALVGRLFALFLGEPVDALALARVGILDTDEAAHAVGSWVLLDGGRLYTDFVDNKPPLLYAYYALAQILLAGGSWPSTSSPWPSACP